MNALRGMLEFIAVVERGSFTGAARQLKVSVSHISRQISELEKRLATQLFIRTTRQMQLTDSGKRLFDASEPLMQKLLHAQETLLAKQGQLEGNVRISLAGKLAEEKVVPLLTRFCLENPQIEMELDFSARNVDLIAEGFHLAVRMGPLESTQSLIATRLLSVPRIVVANPDLLSHLPPINIPVDLPVQWCLPLANRSWEFVRDSQRITIKPQGRLSTNSGIAAVQAALDGLGIVNVLAYYATHEIKAGRLVQLLQDWYGTEKTSFHLVYPAGRHMLPRVRYLIDYLQENGRNMEF